MEWKHTKRGLEKSFTFPDYMSALAFVQKISDLAEEQQHHPDIELGWGYVRVYTLTHDTGSVTEKDQRLAKAIDAISS
jgi:4a-hydroxytetrahydrobiopterin dehydratase